MIKNYCPVWWTPLDCILQYFYESHKSCIKIIMYNLYILKLVCLVQWSPLDCGLILWIVFVNYRPGVHQTLHLTLLCICMPQSGGVQLKMSPVMPYLAESTRVHWSPTGLCGGGKTIVDASTSTDNTTLTPPT